MKKQRQGLNRYNMLQNGKKKKKVSLHMHDTLKTNCDKKKSIYIYIIYIYKKPKKTLHRGSNPHPRK